MGSAALRYAQNVSIRTLAEVDQDRVLYYRSQRLMMPPTDAVCSSQMEAKGRFSMRPFLLVVFAMATTSTAAYAISIDPRCARDARPDRLHLRCPERGRDQSHPRHPQRSLALQTEEFRSQSKIRPVPDQGRQQVTRATNSRINRQFKSLPNSTQATGGQIRPVPGVRFYGQQAEAMVVPNAARAARVAVR